MKKIIFSVISGLFCLFLQAQSFQKNDVMVSAGLGRSVLSAKGWDIYKNIPGFSSKLIQPFTFKIEYAITDEIGLGLSSAYSSATAQWQDSTFSYQSSYNKLSITPRLNIHFIRKKIIDAYLGGGIGYKTGSYRFSTNNSNFNPSIGVIPISLEASLGIRAFITPDLGAFAEFGAGHGYLQFGLVYKPVGGGKNR